MNNFEIDSPQNNKTSFLSLEGENKIDVDKALDLLGKLEGAKETYREYTTTGDGYGRKEQRDNDIYNNSSKSVKILGMPPLVFAVVSLGVILASGVAIVMIGKKA